MDGSPLTQDVDDDELAILPDGTIPTVEPLPHDKRNDVGNLIGMEQKLAEYKQHTDAMQTLHAEWHNAYQTWGNRLDTVYGKVGAIDETVAVILGNEPGSDYEPFEIISLPTAAVMLGALYGVGQGGYSVYKSYQAYKVAKAADNLADIRWAKFTGAAATVGLLFSGYVAYRTIADRTSFLIGALPELEEWFDDGATQITTMKQATEDDFIAEIRKIAVILGVDDPDNNRMYGNVVSALNTAMTDAAEVEAQYKVATRMLCPISGRTPVSYSVNDTATATGLPSSVVQTRSDEIAADPTICAPYQPET